MILFLILLWGAGLYYFFVMSPAARTKGPQYKQKGIIVFIVGALAIYLLASLSSISDVRSKLFFEYLKKLPVTIILILTSVVLL